MDDGEFGGATLGPGNYEDEINHIGISRERTRAPNEQSVEDEQTISRSELGK